MKHWQYYNNAIIPTTYPTEEAVVTEIEEASVWNAFNKTPLLIRWTTNFDCGYPTNWWYVIKDTPFDISLLKSRKRVKIRKALKNFEVKLIDPVEYGTQLFHVTALAYAAYPAKYRPAINEERFLTKTMNEWKNSKDVLGAFSVETNELAGFILLSKADKNYVELTSQKAIPEYERLFVNAALVEGALQYLEEFLSNGGIFCDGARNIFHETSFQDYLEDLFGFRKAYCKLNIKYNPKIKWIIKLLYPFRKLFYLMDSISIFHKVNGVLKMEEIVRGTHE